MLTVLLQSRSSSAKTLLLNGEYHGLFGSRSAARDTMTGLAQPTYKTPSPVLVSKTGGR